MAQWSGRKTKASSGVGSHEIGGGAVGVVVGVATGSVIISLHHHFDIIVIKTH